MPDLDDDVVEIPGTSPGDDNSVPGDDSMAADETNAATALTLMNGSLAVFAREMDAAGAMRTRSADQLSNVTGYVGTNSLFMPSVSASLGFRVATGSDRDPLKNPA